MEEVHYLLMVTKNEDVTTLSFRKDEMKQLCFKRDYFLKHDYEVRLYLAVCYPLTLFDSI